MFRKRCLYQKNTSSNQFFFFKIFFKPLASIRSSNFIINDALCAAALTGGCATTLHSGNGEKIDKTRKKTYGKLATGGVVSVNESNCERSVDSCTASERGVDSVVSFVDAIGLRVIGSTSTPVVGSNHLKNQQQTIEGMNGNRENGFFWKKKKKMRVYRTVPSGLMDNVKSSTGNEAAALEDLRDDFFFFFCTNVFVFWKKQWAIEKMKHTTGSIKQRNEK